jgi:hypothetical protein
MSPITDRLLKPLDHAMAQTLFWRPIEASIIRLARGLRRRRTRVFVERLIEQLRQNPSVQKGRFTGMRYASIEATCSAILPKLLGTYEAELDAVFETLFTQIYDRIIDVGCAEGFYAVGLALRFPNCPVAAFDTDPKARELCSDNAVLNEVDGQVTIGGTIHAHELAALAQGQRNLIICDCEGYEDTLFPEEHAAAYAQSDLVIETHDFITPGIRERLVSRFRPTHQIRIIHSIDDLQKARTYLSDPVDHLDIEVKEIAFAEGRPVIMEWLHLTPLIAN